MSDPDAFQHAWLAGLPRRLPYEATGILPGHLPGSGRLPGRIRYNFNSNTKHVHMCTKLITEQSS